MVNKKNQLTCALGFVLHHQGEMDRDTKIDSQPYHPKRSTVTDNKHSLCNKISGPEKLCIVVVDVLLDDIL